MTAASLSRLPLSAGSALAGSLMHGAAMAVAYGQYFGALGLAQFMRAPVAITCVIAITGFSVLAGSNALFMQTARHPAPLFFSPAKPAAVAPKPVVPAARPRFQPTAIDQETTGSLPPTVATDAIAASDVKALQGKLAQLKLFDGTVDGVFGRRTATAIKGFETKAGMRPTGKLTRRIIDAVLAAPVPAAAQPMPAAVVPQQPAALLATAPIQAAPSAAAATQQVAAQAVALSPAAPATAVPLAPRPIMVPTTVVAPPASVDGDPATPDADGTDLAAADEAAVPATPVVRQQAAPATRVASLTPMDAAPTAPIAGARAIAATLPVAAPPAASSAPAGQTVMAMTSHDDNASAANNPVVDGGVTSAAQRLAAQMGTLPAQAAAPITAASQDASSDPGEGAGSTDPVLISKIQRGLASLGFLGAKIDGVPGEGTAKAIRNFEVFYDYKVTGLATPQLLNLLQQHGAMI